MINIDQYGLYNSLLSAVKDIYVGNFEVILEEITLNLDSDNADSFQSLSPFSLTLKGRVWREATQTIDEQNINFNIVIDYNDLKTEERMLGIIKQSFYSNVL